MLGFETNSPLFRADDRKSWMRALVQRARTRLDHMERDALQRMLEETLYLTKTARQKQAISGH